MIEFVVCDDNRRILEKIVKTIEKIMMKNELQYKISKFTDYDNNFLELINKNDNSRIYILDIETPSYSGIDIARMIRKSDTNSIIIFSTMHNEVGSILLKEELMFLTFICKFDDYENRLESAINKALNIIDNNRVVRVKYNSIIYTIKADDILYVYRDSIDRKCIIVSNNNEYPVNKSLTELMKDLGFNFAYSHRSCIVNKKRISKVDRKNNLIIFDNGVKIDLLTPSCVKELM